MSGEVTQVVETAAKDVSNSIEKGMAHLAEKVGKDIPEGLRASSKTVKGVESDTAKDLEKIGRGDAENLGRDATSGDPVHGEPGTSGRGSGGEPRTPEQEKAEAARTKGADGATDDPVDLVTGEMFLPQEDLALPGVLPFVLERRHGSAYRHGGYFGTTWASTLDQRVVTGDDEIRLALEDGRILHYPVPGGGERVMPSHGPRWPLSWDRSDDVVTVEQGDLGRTLRFPPGTGRVTGPARPLAVIADRGGNEIAFDYDDDGIIAAVRHSGGYHVKVGTRPTLGGVRVTSLALADPSGGADIPVREFQYGMSGRLTGVVNSSGLPLIFEYDDHERITRWEDRNGFEYRYTYRDDGRVVRGEGTDGFLDVVLDYDLDERATTVTDALGHATVHYWNEHFQVVRVVDPLGHETRTEKDLYGNVISATDELGRTTSIERDAYGDPVVLTRPDGSVIELAYNDDRLPVSVIDPDGRAWAYEYGIHGQLTGVVDPAGAEIRYERDSRGRLTGVIDRVGALTSVRCNEAGLETEVADPVGGRIAYGRDAFGNITETVNSLGAVGRYTWTAEGDPLSRSLPDGLSESWEWDAERNLLSHTSTAGQVTRFEYGPFALPVARTDPDGASYRFEYTSQLQLRTVHTAHGQTWDYEYDSTGNLIAEADFNGTRQFYMFDPAHQVTGRSNEAGQETFYGRDVLGRLTERVSGTDRYRYSYNGLGQLEHAEGPGVVMDYARDGVGRIVSETVNGRLLATSFDANGRVVARTTPTGAISEWERDAAGRVVRMRSGADELEFSYDTEGNEISRKLGGSAVLTQSFDTLGRLTAQHIWSLDSRVQGAGNPSANSRRALQSRTYAYGRSGFPERVTDQLRGDHGFTLDQAGRVLRVQGATWHEAYAYDALGNVIEANVPSPDRDGETSGLREFDGSRLRRNGRTLYEYDQAGRLVRKRRRTLSGQTKTWKFEWSADDNLVTVETPANGVWRYSYDPLGRRVAKRHESGDSAGNRGPEETWFTWDGQLVAEQARVSAGGQVKALTWDYRPGTYRPVAQVSRTLSDAAGQREIDREFFAIVTDMVGVPQELIAPNGEISWSTARTTIWGEVNHGGDSGIECPLAFPGQYHDDETGLNYNLNRFYDPETAAYLTPDPLGLAGSENPHRYVTNPVAWIDPLGLKKVYVNDGGRFGDFNPGEKGDGLTPHHMPQDALHFLPRDEGGAIVMSHEDHKLTRTYGARGGVTAKSDKGLPFRDVLQKDLRDVRGIGESQHGDRKYFEPGIKKVLKHYEDKGLLTKQDVKDLSCPYS